jgi:hypothetical protein
MVVIRYPGNDHFMDADIDLQNQAGRRFLRTITMSGFYTSNTLYTKCQPFSVFKCENVIKMKSKPDPILLELIIQ